MHSIMTSNEKLDGVTATASSAFPSHLSRPFDENTKPFMNNNSNTPDHSKLASMLRECANYVERNQFHPIIYGALGALHAYAGDKSGSSPTAVPSSTPMNGTTPSMLPKRDSTPPPPPRRPQPESGEPFVPTPSNRNMNNNSGGGGRSNLGGIGSLGKKVWGGISNQASKKDDKKVSQHLDDTEWCDEHFTMGCSCKRDKSNNAEPSSPLNNIDDNKATTHPPSTNQTSTSNTESKPSFQRPINTTSNLIANGWIEQQRRSKMRIVWKEVLASLVSGRQPSEETTLWIQRQVTSVNGQAELEALHQIPMKWVEDISYLDFYGDHRFAIKVYNFHDEFHFRCGDESGAMNWVSTLRSAREGSLKREREMQAQQQKVDDFDANKEPQQQQQQQVPAAPVQETKRLSIKELRAIAHGAGYNTRGMERKDLEKIAREQGQMPSAAAAAPSPAPAAANEDEIRNAKQLSEQLEAENRRLEQERLETEMRRKKREEEERKRREAMEAEEKRLRDEMNRRKAEELVAEAQARQRQQEEEAQRRKQQEEMERRRQHQEEMERQRAEELERRRREEERKAAEEERRRQEELERRRQQEAVAALEAQRRMAQEQAAAQEQLRRQQEQQAAEQRRRQQEQEEYRRRQEQAAQEHRKYQQSQQAWQRQNFQQQFSSQRFANQQQQQPSSQQYPFNNNNSSNGPPPPPPPNNTNANTNNSPSKDGVNKYAQAMSEEAEQAAITAIKRNILISWALQPPTLQTLRPIDQLVCTIHRVFPPAFGVPGHEYFQKWKPVAVQELQLTNAIMGNGVNEDKLKKAVRKIRFFLHPDKLPNNLNKEQEFMCKMLWDVTSDAWEEFMTRNDELDWVK